MSRDTIRERVRFIMNTVPGADSDDRLLYLTYIHLFVQELPRDLFRKLLTEAPHIESVLRRRREILQEQKLEQYSTLGS